VFHVLSCLHSTSELESAFINTAKNLRRGGIFLFDVWHAPAVLEIGPEERTKRSTSQDLEVTRKATSTHYPLSQLVNVHYEIQVTDGGMRNTLRRTTFLNICGQTKYLILQAKLVLSFGTVSNLFPKRDRVLKLGRFFTFSCLRKGQWLTR